MKKDFHNWHKLKEQIDKISRRLFFHEREVWWCSLGVNIGFEQDGSGKEYRRPVLILKGFSKNTCLIIPLTAATKNHPMRPLVGPVEGKEARALLSQIRVIDSKRLVHKIGFIDKKVFEQIRKIIKDML
ncbi:MAG: type II toxin-antitoxin system PemK/MazF family toxin [Parcubacteria group bacterium]|nr:type II toxin-antitoxin system PemK/MazF family toxin [Parcubacteria group bacterium]